MPAVAPAVGLDRGWSPVDVCARPPRGRRFEPHARTRRVLSRFETRAGGGRRRRAGRRRPRRRWRRVFARRRAEAAAAAAGGGAGRGGGGGDEGRVRPRDRRGVARRPGTAGSRAVEGRGWWARRRASRGSSGSNATEVVTESSDPRRAGRVGDRDPPWRARRRRSSTRDRIDRGCTPRRDRDARIRRRRLHGLVRPHRARGARAGGGRRRARRNVLLRRCARRALVFRREQLRLKMREAGSGTRRDVITPAWSGRAGSRRASQSASRDEPPHRAVSTRLTFPGAPSANSPARGSQHREALV